jgi:heme/copper-type cytochrome/quinol oxidase subunit 3
MTSIPWTYEARPDTRTTNIRLGMWLFLASEAMLFGSLFSAYVLLRTGSALPADSHTLALPAPVFTTVLLVLSTTVLAAGGVIGLRARLAVSSLLFAVFVVFKVVDYGRMIVEGLAPSTNVLLACWFTLTGVHLAHVIGGIAASAWVYVGAGGDPARNDARVDVLRLYWYFVDLVWLAILVSFYLV